MSQKEHQPLPEQCGEGTITHSLSFNRGEGRGSHAIPGEQADQLKAQNAQVAQKRPKVITQLPHAGQLGSRGTSELVYGLEPMAYSTRQSAQSQTGVTPGSAPCWARAAGKLGKALGVLVKAAEHEPRCAQVGKKAKGTWLVSAIV